MPEPQRTEAAQRIMDTAEQLAQTCGFNGFSYADIAVRLGVTKASLHYHFPTKAELGRALIARYHVKFAQELAAIGASAAGPSGHLRSYMDLYYQGHAQRPHVPVRHVRGGVQHPAGADAGRAAALFRQQ